MREAAVTVQLPGNLGGDWQDQFVEELRPQVASLASRSGLDCGLPPVVSQGTETSVLLGGRRYPLPGGGSPSRLASSVSSFINEHLWEAWYAPTLVASGLADQESFWLRHAADRGLSYGDLASLAGSRQRREDHVAWNLAAQHPPRLDILRGPGEASQEAAKKISEIANDCAKAAAKYTGLPIPIPAETGTELCVPGGGVVLAIGKRWIPIDNPDDSDGLQLPYASQLEGQLARLAACFIDPGLVLALCTDPQWIVRRLAVRAIADDNPVRIAERLIQMHRKGELPIDIRTAMEMVVLERAEGRSDSAVPAAPASDAGHS